MSAQAAIPLLCALLAMSRVAIFWLMTKLLSARKELVAERLVHADTIETLATSNEGTSSKWSEAKCTSNFNPGLTKQNIGRTLSVAWREN